MEIIIVLIVNTVLSLTASAGEPDAAGFELVASPQVVATITPSCTGDVPVPTITASVTNHGPGQANLVVHGNSTEIGDLYLNAGQTDTIIVSSPHWEDTDNHFSISDDGEVLATLDHHFDCLHPILDVDIQLPCYAGSVDVTVSNTGSEGAHVVVLLDEDTVAEPPVAPGQTVAVEVAVPDVHYLRVQHHGVTLASTIVECPTFVVDTPDDGESPTDPEGERNGNSLQEGDESGNSIEEVPDDRPGWIGEDGRWDEPELTTPGRGGGGEREERLVSAAPRSARDS